MNYPLRGKKFNGILVILCLFIPILGVGIVNSSTETINTVELTKISQTDTGGDAYDVWVDENKNLAYVTSGYNGFRIFDISDLTQPELLAHVPESPPLLSTGHSSGFAHQLYVYDDIAYLGDGPSGLTIINCADPRNPEVLTHYVGGYTWDIHVANDLAYIVNGFTNIGNPGLMILNISDPSTPLELSNSFRSRDTNDIELIGDNAFIVQSTEGLKILDISNSSNPLLLGQYSGPSGSYAIDVEVSGNLAFLSFWKKGLKILDITDPAEITLVGEYGEFDELAFISIRDDLAYLAAMNDGIVILNITDTNFPIIGNYSDTGRAYGIMASGNHVFVADQVDGLKILEIIPGITSSSPVFYSFYASVLFFSLIACVTVVKYKNQL